MSGLPLVASSLCCLRHPPLSSLEYGCIILLSACFMHWITLVTLSHTTAHALIYHSYLRTVYLPCYHMFA